MSEKVETTGEEKKFELGERARKKKKKNWGDDRSAGGLCYEIKCGIDA